MIRVREGDEERVLTLEEFERRARRGEVSPFAWVSLPTLTGDRFVEARELPFFGAIYDPRRVHFRRHFQVGRFPVLTLLLATSAVALYFVARHLGDGVVTRDALLALGAKARARLLEDGETWRLLAANLLHKDAVHLAFNLFALLNVGAVLEGVYRRGDWALLVVVSGLATMTTSVAFSGPVTVGASGLVFGCLGAAVVFGWRFSDVLPARYRTYFSVVVVIYAAIMFTLGFVSPSTDNWGHGGGLVAGLAMGLVLEPRLLRLRGAREPLSAVLVPWGIALSLCASVLLAGPLVTPYGDRTALHHVDAFGVVLERPAHWTKVADPLGFLTFGNGVDAFASLGCARSEGEKTLDDAMSGFIEGDLRALSFAGNIGALDVGTAGPSTVGEAVRAIPAREIPFAFVSSDGPLDARAIIFVRGTFECALVLAHRPAATASTLGRLAAIQRNLRLERTRAEVVAERAVSSSPSTKAWLALAIAHEAAGAVEDARRAYGAALAISKREPGAVPEAHFAAARFELEMGHDYRRGIAALGPLIGVDGAGVEVEVLLIKLLSAAGDHEGARARLAALVAARPDDAQVKALAGRLLR